MVLGLRALGRIILFAIYLLRPALELYSCEKRKKVSNSENLFVYPTKRADQFLRMLIRELADLLLQDVYIVVYSFAFAY